MVSAWGRGGRCDKYPKTLEEKKERVFFFVKVKKERVAWKRPAKPIWMWICRLHSPASRLPPPQLYYFIFFVCFLSRALKAFPSVPFPSISKVLFLFPRILLSFWNLRSVFSVLFGFCLVTDWRGELKRGMEYWIGIMSVTACVAVVLVVRTAGRDSCIYWLAWRFRFLFFSDLFSAAKRSV